LQQMAPRSAFRNTSGCVHSRPSAPMTRPAHRSSHRFLFRTYSFEQIVFDVSRALRRKRDGLRFPVKFEKSGLVQRPANLAFESRGKPGTDGTFPSLGPLWPS
jgi:hypothetical protein